MQQSALLTDYRALRDLISNTELETLKQRAIKEESDTLLDFGRTRRNLQGRGRGGDSPPRTNRPVRPPTTPAPGTCTPVPTVSGTATGTVTPTTAASGTVTPTTPALGTGTPTTPRAEPQAVFVPPQPGELLHSCNC
jgi:hypothetical protein